MKYLILLLTLVTYNSFAQQYNTLIDEHRKQYKADFLTDKNSPLKEDDIQYLRFFEPDSTYRVTADVEILSDETSFQLPTFNGYKHEYIRFAVLRFALKGQPRQLTVYRNIRLTKMPKYKDHLFLPFTDETNGIESYGGGRYIDVKSGDIKNGHIEIDFNKAYNPYCAYSDGYQCPRPTAENDLTLKLEAGEKKFGRERH